jgi:hypothetical protein
MPAVLALYRARNICDGQPTHRIKMDGPVVAARAATLYRFAVSCEMPRWVGVNEVTNQIPPSRSWMNRFLQCRPGILSCQGRPSSTVKNGRCPIVLCSIPSRSKSAKSSAGVAAMPWVVVCCRTDVREWRPQINRPMHVFSVTEAGSAAERRPAGAAQAARASPPGRPRMRSRPAAVRRHARGAGVRRRRPPLPPRPPHRHRRRSAAPMRR